MSSSGELTSSRTNRSEARAADPTHVHVSLKSKAQIDTLYPMPTDMPDATRLVATSRGFMARFLGDVDARVRLLRDNIQCDRVILALRNGRVVGYLTFKANKRGPFSPGLITFRQEFGHWQGLWRWLLFSTLERRHHSSDVYVCGLKVHHRARQEGVGRILMREVEHQAALLNKQNIDLEVFDKNDGARQFYASLGYTVKNEIGVPRLLRLFSFRKVALMRKQICHSCTSAQCSVVHE